MICGAREVESLAGGRNGEQVGECLSNVKSLIRATE